MSGKKQKKNFIEIIEQVLLILLFICLPMFKGSTDNHGIMILQLILFLLTNLIVIQIVRAGKGFKRFNILEIITICALFLSAFHIMFTSERYNSILLFSNLLFISLFFIIFLGNKKRKVLVNLLKYFHIGLIIQILIGYYQLIFQSNVLVRGKLQRSELFWFIPCGRSAYNPWIRAVSGKKEFNEISILLRHRRSFCPDYTLQDRDPTLGFFSY